MTDPSGFLVDWRSSEGGGCVGAAHGCFFAVLLSAYSTHFEGPYGTYSARCRLPCPVLHNFNFQINDFLNFQKVGHKFEISDNA